ncbi:hypothetical protein GCM10020229_57320 [Kitasatospora albolonga]
MNPKTATVAIATAARTHRPDNDAIECITALLSVNWTDSVQKNGLSPCSPARLSTEKAIPPPPPVQAPDSGHSQPVRISLRNCQSWFHLLQLVHNSASGNRLRTHRAAGPARSGSVAGPRAIAAGPALTVQLV